MNLRTTLHRLAMSTMLLTFAIPVAAADDRRGTHQTHEKMEPLNVVVIVSDDHRADVLGCAGHPIVRTPNLDRLAADGVRFENAFVTTSICAASRASILTGLPERAHHFTFGRPPLAESLAGTSYPARLRAAGHRTGFVGKFGISVEGGRATIDRMFDEFTPITRTPYLKTLPDGSTRHATDLIGDAAVDFLERAATNQPFCLSISFNAGHAEDGDLENHFPPPATEADLHAGVPMPRPRLDGGRHFEGQPAFLRESMNRDRYRWRWDAPEKYDRNLRNYFRMLAGLDRNVGRVLTALDRLGLADDTMVIFLGDNGYYMGERGFAGKWSHYEESLRIPMIVFDPRLDAADRGRLETATTLNIDVSPTVLAAAGLPHPSPPAAGRPLPIVQEAALRASPRAGFLCEHGMKHPDIPRWVGYRTGDLKYARYLDHPEGGEFLHDLRTDPDESVNLADVPARATDLAEMRRACDAAILEASAAGPPLPRVLMIGDSISMGYHATVAASLDDEAGVVRPRENCEGTTKGADRIEAWLDLDGGDFDVVHFNFGLHDLKRVRPDGRNSDDPTDAPQADLDRYESQLRRILKAIMASGAVPVFCTTTPVPSGGVRPHRTPSDVDRYNARALEIMKENAVAVNDLNAFATSRLAEIQIPVNVHFTDRGSAALGDEVASRIRAVLRRRN